MTREGTLLILEDAIKASGVTTVYDKSLLMIAKEAIRLCHDDFESRKCESCKHLQKYSAQLWKTIGVCSNESCSFLDRKVTDTDGCNKWEAKDD